MPRQVDHEGRRLLVADAVLALADERGLEGVTLRDVAARAGVSMGAVQRCFRTKEEMLVFALTHIGERITGRVRQDPAGGPERSARTALRHAATEVSLLRQEHRAEARIWLAFLAQAVVSAPLARTLRTDYAALEDAFTRLVGQAAEETGAQTGPDDARRAARTLLALADGLTAHVLVGHLTPRQAQEVLGGHLAGLLGP
ncbi:TetR/AcrR family transcriptional regulator [Streptomyces antimicrobicus]|uniref:TetR family transcriptional regulator C-terminal domain-containing protein n=1 Tax=Streptomyces antimicrobicus TaxID=2883108 RepID=A0ABS8BAR9_9ACTN|nr:TetR family transcriptional regulator C-terminal domain-containing protein [Streptomyces antimicrobicus]MCB5181712.1 TetR family transcriptional regulator C-terminal domain-containing protein [Streptomyces antimicrobicus]